MSDRAAGRLPGRLRAGAQVAIGARLQARFPFRSHAAIERAQRRRVRAMVEHAYRHVPHYASEMRRLGLSPEQIRDGGDLAMLPPVGPDELGRDPERFLSRAIPRERLIEHRTSGSTGEPRTYFRDKAALPADATHFARVFSLASRAAGKRLRPVQVSILPSGGSALRVQNAYREGSPLSSLGVQHATLSLLDPVERNLAALNEIRPDVIYTFGSYVEALFVHLARSGDDFHAPAAIIHTSDPLSPQIRERISRDWGVLLLGAYQAVEMPQLAFECERHAGLHANRDLYPLRVVRPDGAEAGPGEEGEVIASNLVNRGTVLLNYRLSDLARVLPEPCECGRNLPLIELAAGRSEDWLVRPDGSTLHPQAISMWVYQVPGIWRYQVVQEDPARFSVLVVAAPGADREAIKRQLLEGFERELGWPLSAEISFVDRLPAGAGAKVRPVISRVSPGRAGAR